MIVEPKNTEGYQDGRATRLDAADALAEAVRAIMVDMEDGCTCETCEYLKPALAAYDAAKAKGEANG